MILAIACENKPNINDYLEKYLDKLNVSKVELSYVVIIPEKSCLICVNKVLSIIELSGKATRANTLIIFVDKKQREIENYELNFSGFTMLVDSKRIIRSKEFNDYSFDDIIFFAINNGCFEHQVIEPDFFEKNLRRMKELLND